MRRKSSRKALGGFGVGLFLLCLTFSARAQEQVPRLEILPFLEPRQTITAMATDETHLAAAGFGQVLVWEREGLALRGTAMVPASSPIVELELEEGRVLIWPWLERMEGKCFQVDLASLRPGTSVEARGVACPRKVDPREAMQPREPEAPRPADRLREQGLAIHLREGRKHPFAFAPDGRQVAVAFQRSDELYAGLWDVETGASIKTYGPFGPNCARQLVYAPDGGKLALDINCFVKIDDLERRTSKEMVVVVDLASGRELKLWGRPLYYDRIGFAGEDELLVTSRNGSVFRWSLSKREVVSQWKNKYTTPDGLSPNHFDYCAGSDLFAMQDNDRQPIKLYDPASGQTTVLPGPGHGQRSSLVYAPDGKTLAVAEKRGLELYDVERRTLKTTLAWPEDFRLNWVRTAHGVDGDLVFHPGGRLLAAGSLNKVLLFDLDTHKALWRRMPGPAAVFQLAFQPGRERLAVSTDDGVMRLYDYAADALVWELVLFDEGQWLLHRPADGRYVASDKGDAAACLWVEDAPLGAYALRDFSALLRKVALPPVSEPLSWPADALRGKRACRSLMQLPDERAAGFSWWVTLVGAGLFFSGLLGWMALRRKKRA